jgi:large subunit ribosomal protein L30
MAVKKEAQKGKKVKKNRETEMDEELKIELTRSVIGRPQKQREIVKGLGLRKLHSVVVRKNCPEIRGMIRKIPHLVTVEVLEKK